MLTLYISNSFLFCFVPKAIFNCFVKMYFVTYFFFRISGGADADKVNKLPIFDSRPGNRYV